MAACCAASKPPPAVAALRVGQQAGQPFGLVLRQPAVHGVGVPHLQQAVQGHPVGGVARRDLEYGRTALPHIRPRVMVPMDLQLALLLLGQHQRAS